MITITEAEALIMAAGTEAWDLQATVRDDWDLCNRGEVLTEHWHRVGL